MKKDLEDLRKYKCTKTSLERRVEAEEAEQASGSCRSAGSRLVHEASLNVPILGVKLLVVSNEKATGCCSLVEHSTSMH